MKHTRYIYSHIYKTTTITTNRWEWDTNFTWTVDFSKCGIGGIDNRIELLPRLEKYP